MKLFFAAIISFGFIALSCAVPVTPPKGDSGAVKRNAKLLEDDVLALVNQYRQGKGLGILQSNSSIAEIARMHSGDMARGDVPFSHNGFDERSKKLAAIVPGMNSAAENVAYGQRTAKEVVNDWIKSPGHRSNIEGNFTLTGIGIMADKNGVLYYTQIFAR